VEFFVRDSYWENVSVKGKIDSFPGKCVILHLQEYKVLSKLGVDGLTMVPVEGLKDEKGKPEAHVTLYDSQTGNILEVSYRRKYANNAKLIFKGTDGYVSMKYSEFKKNPYGHIGFDPQSVYDQQVSQHYIGIKDFAQALKYANKVSDRSVPGLGGVYFQIGAFYGNNSNWAESIACFRTASLLYGANKDTAADAPIINKLADSLDANQSDPALKFNYDFVTGKYSITGIGGRSIGSASVAVNVFSINPSLDNIKKNLPKGVKLDTKDGLKFSMETNGKTYDIIACVKVKGNPAVVVNDGSKNLFMDAKGIIDTTVLVDGSQCLIESPRVDAKTGLVVAFLSGKIKGDKIEDIQDYKAGDLVVFTGEGWSLLTEGNPVSKGKKASDSKEQGAGVNFADIYERYKYKGKEAKDMPRTKVVQNGKDDVSYHNSVVLVIPFEWNAKGYDLVEESAVAQSFGNQDITVVAAKKGGVIEYNGFKMKLKPGVKSINFFRSADGKITDAKGKEITRGVAGVKGVDRIIVEFAGRDVKFNKYGGVAKNTAPIEVTVDTVTGEKTYSLTPSKKIIELDDGSKKTIWLLTAQIDGKELTIGEDNASEKGAKILWFTPLTGLQVSSLADLDNYTINDKGTSAELVSAYSEIVAQDLKAADKTTDTYEYEVTIDGKEMKATGA
ncbi:MAG: hypothetical protein ABIH71_08145, partial [Candidatus Omnitrophota bacterium]